VFKILGKKIKGSRGHFDTISRPKTDFFQVFKILEKKFKGSCGHLEKNPFWGGKFCQSV
jgi:hypothetical protein